MKRFNFHAPSIQTGIRLAFLALGIATMNVVAIAMALFMPVGTQVTPFLGWVIKLKKDGATDANLALLNDLEKRFMELPDGIEKQAMETILNERFKDFEGIKWDEARELLGTGDRALRTILTQQGEELSRLKLQLSGEDKPVSVRKQITDWQTRNKEAIAAIKGGTKAPLAPLELRLNSPMLPSNTLNGSAYLPRPEFEAGAVDLLRNEPTFWDYIPKGRTSAQSYVWVNKTSPEGAAAFIGPGVAKPGVSLELNTEISYAKKIAESMKMAMELMDDVDGFMSFMLQELKYQHDIKISNILLKDGVLSSTVPASIQSMSVPFTASGLATSNPNNFDAMRAIQAQLRSGNLRGPVTTFLNPIDKANMDMTKAISLGAYLNPNFALPTIVEDNNVPVGFVQAAMLNYYRVLIYKDYTVTFGWENDDFTKNLVTAVAESRIHNFVSQNHTGFAIYDELADIRNAIAAA